MVAEYGHLCCTSIEAELERLFASVTKRAHYPRMKSLRKTLHVEICDTSAWPQRNFCRSGDQLVSALKKLNENQMQRRLS